jgi:hypothetical protein
VTGTITEARRALRAAITATEQTWPSDARERGAVMEELCLLRRVEDSMTARLNRGASSKSLTVQQEIG